MEPSVTAILTVSLGGVFVAAVVTVLIAARRKKAATDRRLDNGPVPRGGASSGAVAPTFLAAATDVGKPDGTTNGSYSDSGVSPSGSDGGGGGGCD